MDIHFLTRNNPDFKKSPVILIKELIKQFNPKYDPSGFIGYPKFTPDGSKRNSQVAVGQGVGKDYTETDVFYDRMSLSILFKNITNLEDIPDKTEEGIRGYILDHYNFNTNYLDFTTDGQTATFTAKNDNLAYYGTFTVYLGKIPLESAKPTMVFNPLPVKGRVYLDALTKALPLYEILDGYLELKDSTLKDAMVVHSALIANDLPAPELNTKFNLEQDYLVSELIDTPSMYGHYYLKLK